MSTNLIHLSYEGNFETKCITKIKDITFLTDINKDNNNVTIILEDTVMYPQGGGQPCDYGIITILESSPKDDDDNNQHPILSIPISKVNIDKNTGIVTHDGNIDSTVEEKIISMLKSGSIVVQVTIDEKRRRILSECHTSGHLVDNAMAKIGQTSFIPTKGYHFLDGPYVEYKGAVPPNQRSELLESLKVAFQELINENIKTEIENFTREMANEKCNRTASNFDFSIYPSDKELRIVTIAGLSCPCGGTHVSNTIDLKDNGWHITGIKCKKDVTRIKYNYNKV